MINKFFKIILVLLVFCSCANNSKNEFVGAKHLNIDSFASTYDIKADSLSIEVIGLQVVAVADTFLLGFDYLGRNNFINVYSTNDYEFLGSLISKGRGPNELLTVRYRDQWEKDSLGCHIWIDDDGFSPNSFKLNITKSLEKEETVFESKIAFIDYPCFTRYFVNDSTFIGFDFLNGPNTQVLKYNLRSQKTYSQTNLFKRDFINKEEKRVYAFNTALNEMNKGIAAASYYLDEISIMTNDFSKILACKVGNSPVSATDVFKIERSKRLVKYIGLRVTDDLIFALYVNKLFSEIQNDENTSGSEIHVFKWTGEAVAKVRVKENLFSISIDESNKCIYANTMNEQIYKYDFSEIIE